MSHSKKAAIEVPEDHRKGNRRAFPRWKADFEVRYGMGSEMMDGIPNEIGEGGISLTVEKLYRLGGKDSKDGWITVKSIVRHAVNKSLGVEFLNLRRHDRLRILDFINGKK